MAKRHLRESLPPGPAIPSVIQLVATWTRPGASLLRLRERYGRRLTVQLPFQPPFVILSDPDDIKELFTASPEAIHPGEGARILEPIVGRYSLILLDEAPHLEHRRLLLPAFHGERMQQLTGLMTELTERELDTWPTNRPVPLHPHLQRLTLEIILRAVFGLEQGQRLDDLRAALTEVLAFSESPLSIMPWLQRRGGWLPQVRRFRRVLSQTDELIFEQVRERRAAAEAGTEPGYDVLGMLLAARHEPDDSPMSDQELRDELVTALVAGHETTASQLAWAFAQLAREPRVAHELTAELDAGQSDAYLTATMYEILRQRPVLPNAEPRLTKQPVRIGGHEYPAGVALLASAFLVHHDPEIYPDPFAFRPERFLESSPGTYSWIPFGGGRRRCLGASFAQQEMKIVLASVLRRFALTPGTLEPEQTARRSITFSPSAGATVVLRERRVDGYQPKSGPSAPDQGVRQLPAEAALAGDPARGS
jgi:cytochrome P450